jgi:two-component system cell cycle sensor histidine kinase/response regulator CckA
VSADVTGTATILLAEDDNSVRGIVSRVLTTHGYRVLEASRGDDALALWRAHHGETGRIDLLVTDVMMPGSTGRELVHELRAIEPSLPVLFTSGYLEDAATAGDDARITQYLEKPFATAKLLLAVRQLLATRGV